MMPLPANRLNGLRNEVIGAWKSGGNGWRNIAP